MLIIGILANWSRLAMPGIQHARAASYMRFARMGF